MYIGPIIGASAKIAEYLGLIEGVNSNLTKLIHQSLRSAISNLEYAKYAEGQNQREYILQAKNEFIRAVAVEENEAKVLALVGLSMCQNFLGEINNAKSTMNKISSVELSRSEKAKYYALDTVRFLSAPMVLPFASIDARKLYFLRVKDKAKTANLSLLS